ncbi:MAG: ACT domain-containing protein, partial [Lactobacillus sp.]|nr:ACT domain-containing protein [Lactobacillus sp.]
MKAILTISGEDKIGIIAQISKILAEEEVYILNISQNLMDNNFTTTIMIKITDGKDLKKIDKSFDNLGNQMGAKIDLRNEEVYSARNYL